MATFSTPDLSDASPAARAIELQFVNAGGRTVFSGAAVTIKCHEDNSLVKALVDEPGNGRVIVVDGGGSQRRALLAVIRPLLPLITALTEWSCMAAIRLCHHLVRLALMARPVILLPVIAS